MSSLDIDDAQSKKKEDPAMTAQIPEKFRKLQTWKKSVSSEASQHSSQFRLEALTDDFFEPLQALLGEKNHFFSTMSSLDCLAVGYLVLMLRTDTPHHWLRTALENKYSSLGKWVNQMSFDSFGQPCGVNEALNPNEYRSSTSVLPWKAELEPSLAISIFSATTLVLENGPWFSSLQKDRTIRRRADVGSAEISRKLPEFYSHVISLTMGLGLVTGAVLHFMVSRLPRETDKRFPPLMRRNFGEAGTMLGL